MKKSLILFLSIISTFLFIGNVQAIEIDKDDIASGSYVIGAHLFERKVTEHYDGTLTVKHIMLAAQSIGSDNIEDMVIYLKNSRGKWVDGLTNEEISVPEKIKIDYQNTVDIKVPVPYLKSMGGSSGEIDYIAFTEGKYMYYLGININDEQYNNVELYEKNGDNYTLIDTVDVGTSMIVYIEPGDKKTYTSKLCKIDNNKKVCSDYSNELTFDTMKLFANSTLEKECEIDKCSLSLKLNDNVNYRFEKQYEIYEIKHGEYVYVDSGVINDEDLGQSVVSVDITSEPKTYVARIVLNPTSGKKYSEYSNEITISTRELLKDTSSELNAQYPQNNFYQDGKYNYYMNLDVDGWHNVNTWILYEIGLDGSKTPIMTDYIGNPIKVQVEAGKNKQLMASICNSYGDQHRDCLEVFSDIFEIDTKEFLKKPELRTWATVETEPVYDLSEGSLKVGLFINHKDYYLPTLQSYPLVGKELIQGVQVKKVLANGDLEEVSDISFGFEYTMVYRPGIVPIGEVGNFVARVYIEDTEGNRFYSEYSDELVIDSKDIPLFEVQHGGENGEGHQYVNLIISYLNYDDKDGVEVYYYDNEHWNLYDEEKVEDGVLDYVKLISFPSDMNISNFKYKIRFYEIDEETGKRIYTPMSPVISMQ